MSLPLLSLIVGPGVLVSRPGQGHFFYFQLKSHNWKAKRQQRQPACASEMLAQGGGREGGHGRGQSDRSFGSGGRRKGKSHAGPGRPTQSVHVATPKDGAGSRAIYEYLRVFRIRRCRHWRAIAWKQRVSGPHRQLLLPSQLVVRKTPRLSNHGSLCSHRLHLLQPAERKSKSQLNIVQAVPKYSTSVAANGLVRTC